MTRASAKRSPSSATDAPAVLAWLKRLGRNHELAAGLWESGWYEARMMATFLDEPARVTSLQMDRWVKQFDNWAICDTACFHLFDRTPHAWGKVEKWAGRREEFIKRTAFALLWSLTVHDKLSHDKPSLRGQTPGRFRGPDGPMGV